MNVTGPCLQHYIMCQRIKAQRSCFTNGCSSYVCGPDTLKHVSIVCPMISPKAVSSLYKSIIFTSFITVSELYILMLMAGGEPL